MEALSSGQNERPGGKPTACDRPCATRASRRPAPSLGSERAVKGAGNGLVTIAGNGYDDRGQSFVRGSGC